MDRPIDHHRSPRAFFYELLRTPSPTGNECAVQMLVHDYLAPFAHEIRHDIMGNLYFGFNTAAAEGGAPSIMLAAHCDQVGFMIKRIDENGFAFLDYLGGIDESAIAGCRVQVTCRRRRHGLDLPPLHGQRGCQEVRGVLGKKATHLQSQNERDKTPTKGELWLDIGASSREEAERMVQPGDYGTFELDVVELAGNRVTASALDDKAGLYACCEAFRRCATGEPIDCALWVVSTVQEEVGSRGAEAAVKYLSPTAAIAVDLTNASDDPSGSKKTEQTVALGKGPCISHGPNTNPVLEGMLRLAAERHSIRHQLQPSTELEANDAKPMQVASGALAAASLSIPNRNMHTQAEVCDLRDIDATINLLAAFVRSVRPDTDFRPMRGAWEQPSIGSNGKIGGEHRMAGRRR